MNGRIYDPLLGRFLQADPHIQAPKNTQNYNRYSYVLNNPMSYTDPSGFFFNKLFKGINKALGDFAPIAAIGLAIIGQSWAAQGIWQAATIGFVSGGVATGSLKGALIGAFTAAAFQQIGQHFQDAGWQNDFLNNAAGENSPFFKNFTSFGGNSLTSSQIAQQIAAHATVGGVAATLNGGKFGHGFLSAGLTKGAGGFLLQSGSNLNSKQVIAGTAASAVIGGTTSKITGGKFGNGASTSAFQYLFNQVLLDYKNVLDKQPLTVDNLRVGASVEGAGIELFSLDSTGEINGPGLSLQGQTFRLNGETSHSVPLDKFSFTLDGTKVVMKGQVCSHGPGGLCGFAQGSFDSPMLRAVGHNTSVLTNPHADYRTGNLHLEWKRILDPFGSNVGNN